MHKKKKVLLIRKENHKLNLLPFEFTFFVIVLLLVFDSNFLLSRRKKLRYIFQRGYFPFFFIFVVLQSNNTRNKKNICLETTTKWTVKVRIRSRQVFVEGPRGKLYRSFKHAQVAIRIVPLGSSQHEAPQGVEKKETDKLAILVEKRMSRKKKCSVVKTIAGHIKNMMTGVKQGFRYKMKLVYAHFPITAAVTDEGKKIELRNYIGQKTVRRISMMDGVKIVEPGSKDEYWLEGNDIETVSHSGMCDFFDCCWCLFCIAAKIWQSCRVTNKDIRKFLDGVYVYAKGAIGDEREKIQNTAELFLSLWFLTVLDFYKHFKTIFLWKDNFRKRKKDNQMLVKIAVELKKKNETNQMTI
ncbi:hypothetical protein RFI_03101 [Reticulomyxa filosa]|uniref:Uncharacterized protein n=1 Tax=Reticulomyxa filosa TaxID=46433 RepID=X6P7F6_RETFI|nr:hypothetical protein RFI_03101 [Reticulomyxa filosa]|eukprot:ETO33994.1 hypothetical protein RFI_03101 [Reticulomyxa filosa]